MSREAALTVVALERGVDRLLDPHKSDQTIDVYDS